MGVPGKILNQQHQELISSDKSQHGASTIQSFFYR